MNKQSTTPLTAHLTRRVRSRLAQKRVMVCDNDEGRRDWDKGVRLAVRSFVLRRGDTEWLPPHPHLGANGRLALKSAMTVLADVGHRTSITRNIKWRDLVDASEEEREQPPEDSPLWGTPEFTD